MIQKPALGPNLAEFRFTPPSNSDKHHKKLGSFLSSTDLPILFRVLPEIFNWSSIRKNFWWGTVLNAFLKSKAHLEWEFSVSAWSTWYKFIFFSNSPSYPSLLSLQINIWRGSSSHLFDWSISQPNIGLFIVVLLIPQLSQKWTWHHYRHHPMSHNALFV